MLARWRERKDYERGKERRRDQRVAPSNRVGLRRPSASELDPRPPASQPNRPVFINRKPNNPYAHACDTNLCTATKDWYLTSGSE